MLDYHPNQAYVPAKSESHRNTRDWERYLRLKSATQKTCREAYKNYLIKTLTIVPTGNKRHCALIKSKQHDHLGVAPFEEGSIIYSDPEQKAHITTVNSPLSMQMAPRHHNQTLDLVHIRVWKNITVSSEGVAKLLKNFKPHKDAGPGDIPLMLLM